MLLRTLAAPINPADVNTVQGTYGVRPEFSPLIGTPEPSAIPGGEGVFEVLASTSPALRPGDWAIPARTGFGTWRTHAVAPADALVRVADEDRQALTPLQVATVAVNPCSAYRMLRDFVGRDEDGGEDGQGGGGGGGRGPLREGDWFIQNGANSGVGRAAIQLGRLWGLRSVNVVRARATDEETRALRDELTRLGATHVVTEDEFLARDFRDRAAEWTSGDGAGIRLGLNCVGGRSAQAVARSLGAGGTMVTYGGMARQPVALPTALLIFRDVRLRGFWLSRWADARPAARASTVADLLALARRGLLEPAPVEPVPWRWDAGDAALRAAVQASLDPAGFRAGKAVFVFEDT